MGWMAGFYKKGVAGFEKFNYLSPIDGNSIQKNYNPISDAIGEQKNHLYKLKMMMLLN